MEKTKEQTIPEALSAENLALSLKGQKVMKELEAVIQANQLKVFDALVLLEQTKMIVLYKSLGQNMENNVMQKVVQVLRSGSAKA